MKRTGLIILAGILLCLSLIGCNQKATDQQVKYVLYCGLNDADTKAEELTVEDAQSLARAVFVSKKLGYTEYVTTGAYTDDTGMVHQNNTLVYALFFVNEADAKAVAREIKANLNLDSVLVETVANRYEFAE